MDELTALDEVATLAGELRQGVSEDVIASLLETRGGELFLRGVRPDLPRVQQCRLATEVLALRELVLVDGETNSLEQPPGELLFDALDPRLERLMDILRLAVEARDLFGLLIEHPIRVANDRLVLLRLIGRCEPPAAAVEANPPPSGACGVPRAAFAGRRLDVPRAST